MDNDIPDLNQVYVFTKVVEEGSFTGAAQLLAMPKSTVSLKVSQLEERLGVRLLQRTTRSLRLTDDGEAFYDRCQIIIADLENAEADAKERGNQPRGRFRITVPVALAENCVGRWAAEYALEYPNVRLEMVAEDRPVNLVEEGFDLALRGGDLHDSSLIAKRLGSSPVGFYASPQYLAEHGVPKQPRDLAQHDCIPWSAHGILRSWTLHKIGARKAISIAISPRIHANNLSIAAEAAKAGLGVTPLPGFVAAEATASGLLKQVLPSWITSDGALSAVYPSTRHLSLRVRTMIDFLTVRLRDEAWLTAP